MEKRRHADLLDEEAGCGGFADLDAAAAGGFEGDDVGESVPFMESDGGSDGEAEGGEPVGEFGVVAGEAVDEVAVAFRALGEGFEGGGAEVAGGVGDGAAVGVEGGVVEEFVEEVDDVVGEGVFEDFGFGVDLGGGHAEAVGEEDLDDPVAADDLDGGGPTEIGEADAAAWEVVDESVVGELPGHGGDRSGGEIEGSGECAEADGVLGAADGVDGFEVVFAGGGNHAGKAIL